MIGARLLAGSALFSLALGILASWRLIESGVGIASKPDFFFLIAGVLGALWLLVPRAGNVSRTKIAAIALWCSGVFALGLGWGCLRLSGPPSLPVPSQGMAILRLTIVENPRLKSDDTRARWSCLARVRGVVDDDGSRPLDQNAWLSFESKLPPRPGDRLIARGTLHPVQPPRNPGEFDLRRWAADRSIAGTFTIPAPVLLRPDESPAGVFESAVNVFRRAIGATRQHASKTVDELASLASPEARELLRGLLLGENPRSSSEGLASFYRLGLAHILSISGFHLVVFAGAALFALRLLGDLGRLEPILVTAAVLLFLVIVPANSPLIRAATILLVLLGAEMLGRRYDRLTLLAWTAVALLLVHPSELWSLGFQLSFGLTAALLALAPRLSLRLFPRPLGIRPVPSAPRLLWSRASHAIIALGVTGLLCWTLSAPWIAANVGIFNPLSILTNVLITPIIVVALWLGYAALLVGMVFPMFAELLALPMSIVADFAISTARWWDSLPIATIRVPQLSTAWALASTLLLTLWFVRARLRSRGFVACACVLLAWGLAEITFGNRLPKNVAARAYLLDVFPGSCTIVRTHEQAIMINAGADGRELTQIARALGAWRLDTLILDAREERSFSGATEVVRTLRPHIIIFAGDASPLPAPAAALAHLAEQFGATIRTAPSVRDAVSSLPIPFEAGQLTREPGAGMQTRDFQSGAE
ncbi:MAG: ComEC family competence protein [Phycisphaeraceae bacterium]|nr:ComEC family competence protein [Phycisphaeraceae bacterium]